MEILAMHPPKRKKKQNDAEERNEDDNAHSPGNGVNEGGNGEAPNLSVRLSINGNVEVVQFLPTNDDENTI